MELLPPSIRAQIPPIYAQQNVDAIAYVKLFTPDANWTWFITEFDGEDLCFGLVRGHEEELGYFSLAELQTVCGSLGLPIESDLYFDPTPVS